RRDQRPARATEALTGVMSDQRAGRQIERTGMLQVWRSQRHLDQRLTHATSRARDGESGGHGRILLSRECMGVEDSMKVPHLFARPSVMDRSCYRANPCALTSPVAGMLTVAS